LPLIDDVDGTNPNPHALDYWTGFYSSRPNFKNDIRIMMQNIRLHNKLLTFLALQTFFLTDKPLDRWSIDN
jgi:hypothetical protein